MPDLRVEPDYHAPRDEYWLPPRRFSSPDYKWAKSWTHGPVALPPAKPGAEWRNFQLEGRVVQINTFWKDGRIIWTASGGVVREFAVYWATRAIVTVQSVASRPTANAAIDLYGSLDVWDLADERANFHKSFMYDQIKTCFQALNNGESHA